jgi:hypothetical protein
VLLLLVLLLVVVRAEHHWCIDAACSSKIWVYLSEPLHE